MTTTHPFVVQASKPRVTVAYNCPTPEWALKKLSDLQTAGYDAITITGPDEQSLTEGDLQAMIKSSVNGVRRRPHRSRSQSLSSGVPSREASAT